MEITVTKLEAAVKQVTNKAVSGDLLAMKQLTTFARAAEIETAVARNSQDFSEVDQKIMARFFKRQQKSKNGEDKWQQ